jgi:hypothetical protein
MLTLEISPFSAGEVSTSFGVRFALIFFRMFVFAVRSLLELRGQLRERLLIYSGAYSRFKRLRRLLSLGGNLVKSDLAVIIRSRLFIFFVPTFKFLICHRLPFFAKMLETGLISLVSGLLSVIVVLLIII